MEEAGILEELLDRVAEATEEVLAGGTEEEEGDAMLEETAELTEVPTEEDERGCRQPDTKQANASTAIQAGIKRMKITPHQTEKIYHKGNYAGAQIKSIMNFRYVLIILLCFYFFKYDADVWEYKPNTEKRIAGHSAPCRMTKDGKVLKCYILKKWSLSLIHSEVSSGTARG